jgi:DNA primase
MPTDLEGELLNFLLARLPQSRPYQGGVKSSCVYHSDRTPSFFVYYDHKWKKQWWFKCQGCGETGSLNKLLKKLQAHHLLLPETRFIRPDKEEDFPIYKLDVTIGFHRYYEYFRERGVSDSVSERFGFCMDFYAPGAVMPVYTDGRYHGYVMRNLDDRLPKYHISAGMDVSKVIWGLDDVNESETVYVTEGIIDAACLWSAGYQAVALISKESFKSKYHRLQGFCNTVLVPDNDKSGLATARELAREIGASIEFVPHEFKDVSEWRTHKKTS